MTHLDNDLIVIGLGAMGSSAVDAAATAGLGVVGFDQFPRGHANGSSHGPTRMLRRSVEEGPAYVPLVLDAIERWRALGDELDAPVFLENGALRVAPIGSKIHTRMVASAVAYHLEFERLSGADVEREFPGFSVPDGYEGLYEREAGVLLAADAVHALQDRAIRYGADLRFDSPVLGWRPDGDGVEVRTASGIARASRLVITAGSWTTRLAGELGLPLTVERVVNVSFSPRRPELFGPDVLPAFVVSNGADGAYGIPALTGLGVKVGGGGTATDPDRVDRVVGPDDIARLRSWVDRFLPEASGPVRSVLTCLYTVAPDGHFVIDRHPEFSQVVVASPCSGHGFKYTTAIGPLLVELATTGSTRIPIDAFAIGRFTGHAAAEVTA